MQLVITGTWQRIWKGKHRLVIGEYRSEVCFDASAKEWGYTIEFHGPSGPGWSEGGFWDIEDAKDAAEASIGHHHAQYYTD